MWGDLFQKHNIRILCRILRRSDHSLLEIVTKEEDKYLIEYIKGDKIWKIEHINTDGSIKLDFQPSLTKNLIALPDVQHLLIRRKSIDDDRRSSI